MNKGATNILPGRVIPLIGDIDEDLFESFLKDISYLDNSSGAITIKFTTDGGCTASGWAIYDSIRECKNHITIKGYGKVSSMGAIIMQAADERILMPNSYMMVHIGTKHLNDHSENVDRWNTYLNTVDGRKFYNTFLSKIKEKKPRFTKKKLKELLIFDTILTPNKALDLGLIDKIGEIK